MEALLIDLDGVVWEGERPVEGAGEALRWLEGEGIPHLFVTNTTSKPRARLVDKLGGMGIGVEADRILSPAVATARWLPEHAPGPAALFVPEATREDLGDLEVLPAGAEEGAASVVLGDLGDAWDFESLNRAFRLLMADPEALLVALGMTRYWKAEDGLRLDVAPFVAALQHATGREPVVLGKPARPFFEEALRLVGAGPDGVAMIGDDVVGDVGGAQRQGITGVLVRTGKFRPSDLAGDVAPDAVLDSIADLPEWWRRQRTS